MDEDCADFTITNEDPVDEETAKFDAIVGALEELLASEAFAARQAAFLRRHCDVFEDTEENKLEYTTLFDEYTSALEDAMETSLGAAVEGFDMTEFAEMLAKREGTGELDGDAFDLLMTLSSFDAFKELMLAYKAEKHGVGVFAEGEGEGGGGLGGLGVEGVGGGAFAVGGGGLNIGSVADGAEGASFSVGVSVSPAKEREEEMLDGDERPDLDDGLVITRGPGGEEGP